MPVTDQQIATFAAAARQSRPDRDAAAVELGRRASQAAGQGIPFERKIRLCAGDPDNGDNEALTKSLAVAASGVSDFQDSIRLEPRDQARAAAAPGARRPTQAAPHSSILPPAPTRAAPAARAWAYRVGDTVRFQHGRVVGNGTIVCSGKDGVTLQDKDGTWHQVRHEYVLPPAPRPTFVGPSQAEHVGGRHLSAGLAFYDFRDRLAGDIRSKRVTADPPAIVAHAVTSYGLSQSDAAEWTERFMASIGRDLERRGA